MLAEAIFQKMLKAAPLPLNIAVESASVGPAVGGPHDPRVAWVPPPPPPPLSPPQGCWCARLGAAVITAAAASLCRRSLHLIQCQDRGLQACSTG